MVAVAPPSGLSAHKVWQRTGPVSKVWEMFTHRKADFLTGEGEGRTITTTPAIPRGPGSSAAFPKFKHGKIKH